jgi:hypothetical protein
MKRYSEADKACLAQEWEASRKSKWAFARELWTHIFDTVILIRQPRYVQCPLSYYFYIFSLPATKKTCEFPYQQLKGNGP